MSSLGTNTEMLGVPQLQKKATYVFLIYSFPPDTALTGAEFVGIFYLLAYWKKM